jgi:hypothetical protein
VKAKRSNRTSHFPAFQTVGVAGRYSNRPDLLEQLQRVAAILSNGGQDNSTGAKIVHSPCPLANLFVRCRQIVRDSTTRATRPRTPPENTWRALIRPDLLQQLRKVAAVLSDGGRGNGTGAEVASEGVVRSRRLRDHFSLDDLQVMIDVYRSGATAKAVAEQFGIGLRSVKRLLHQYGVRRERRK